MSECIAIAVRQRSEPPLRRAQATATERAVSSSALIPVSSGSCSSHSSMSASASSGPTGVHSIGHGAVRSAAAATPPPPSTPTARTGGDIRN